MACADPPLCTPPCKITKTKRKDYAPVRDLEPRLPNLKVTVTSSDCWRWLALLLRAFAMCTAVFPNPLLPPRQPAPSLRFANECILAQVCTVEARGLPDGSLPAALQDCCARLVQRNCGAVTLLDVLARREKNKARLHLPLRVVAFTRHSSSSSSQS